MSRVCEIKKAYNLINNYIDSDFNSSDIRKKTRELLECMLNDNINRVICDETNNTPDIIDKIQMIARVEWNGDSGKISYIDLVFGNVNLDWKEDAYNSNFDKPIDVSRKVFLIDIDGTVCDDIKNEDSHLYATAKVFPGAREMLNKWYYEGNVITFFTARQNKDREVTEKWLNDNGFKYHGLVMDKPRIKDGQTYHWIDNKPTKATTYKGKWTDLVKVTKEIDDFK